MNVLLVDDHPMTVEGFKSALLNTHFNKYEAVFTEAHTCEGAYRAIHKAMSVQKVFDLAIVDQGLPHYPEQSLHSGSDVVVLLKKYMPNCKVIMITAHTEVIIVYDIAKKIRPDGLVIKNDITPTNLYQIVTAVLSGTIYQSAMVKSCINEIWKKELMIEDYNRQILLYLSKGFKVKELEAVVPLTTSAIQKRIIRMKKVFDVSDDTGLVKEAIHQGFI
nr:response regulator [uncultured Flavobacterium sp.]